MAKILMMAAALRIDSYNKKLIKNAHRILSAANLGHEIELLSFNDFAIPIYDGDVEEKDGMPAAVRALSKKVSGTDALIFSTPEYNGGIPGAFKNAIDWVSRVTPMPWNGKHILLMGASPGALGAIRGLWHTRVPLEACGSHVFPEMMGLARASQEFDEAGLLKDPSNEKRLTALLTKFSAHISR